MKQITHKKVVTEFYEVRFHTSNRGLSEAINNFLADSPEMDDDDWSDNHTVLRDHEGDFNGILIYNTDKTKHLIDWICKKIGAAEEMSQLNFRLTW